MLHIPTTHPPFHVGMVQIPLPPNATPIVTLAVDPTSSGMYFHKSGSRSNPNVYADDIITPGNASVTISMVNGRPMNG